ncbi:S1 family peptidase [Corynebacterium pseudotuberculosis]|uniref:S1 family peptidase n=1 Tax=Corynebacterium pseudotuberculosis TaxID=1719 RepID=UPI0020C870B7|nr:S1 family peptidase [Corynebacterium pseudotuberculosis]UTO24905.1 S1 family peptidase [Corynebacterium pseudotuberculosis]
MLNSWKSQVSRAFYARFGRQILVAIMATALVSTGHSTVPSAVAVEPFRMERTADNKPILRQGDKFRIKWGSQGHEVGTFCTVGYIDQERKLIFSAAHCVGSRRATFHLADWSDLGTLAYMPKDINPLIGGDFIAIDYSKNADRIVVENPYADHLHGDTLIDRNAEVCAYGVVTKTVRCGHFSTHSTATFNDGIEKGGIAHYNSTPHSKPGDSGGPVWLKESGKLIGVHYGAQTGYSRVTLLPRKNGKVKLPDDVTIPGRDSDMPPITSVPSTSEVADPIIPVEPGIITPEGTPSSDTDQKTSSTPSHKVSSPGPIIGIIAAVAAVFGIAAFGMAQVFGLPGISLLPRNI